MNPAPVTSKPKVTYRTHLGPHFSEGARLVWMRLREIECGIAGGARLAEIDRAQFYRFLHGDRVPSIAEAAKMKRAFGAPIDAWNEKPRRKFSLT
jgi:hypothetical protein